MVSDVWEAPAGGPLHLPSDEVHVWRIPLVVPAHELEALATLLAPAELDRAGRFRAAVHRDAFIAGRGAQRRILARYTGVPAAEIRYRESPYGKLALDGRAAEQDLRFNVSNSGALALLAIARGRELGVDLEQLKPMPDATEIAGRFFSAPENAVFAALERAEREAAFFRCWTRKEAYVKAVGEGLSMPLDRFDVAFAPGEPPRLLATRGDPGEAARWRMAAVDPGPDYVSALAVAGDGWRLRAFDWSGR